MPKTKKKAGAATEATKVNKSAWIREQPPGMPAKDVVDKAKGQGIKLTVAQVYTARSNAKAAKRKGAKAKPVAASGSASVTFGARDANETAFRRLVLTIGLSKADAVIRDLKRDLGV